MSAIVVKISKVGKHPKADNLELTTVNGRTTIFPRGDFCHGDLAVYIEPGTVVPCARPEFSWLSKKPNHRVRKAYIRKIPSYGFLIKWEQGDGPEGTDISEDLEIEVPSKKTTLLERVWLWLTS